MLQRLVGHDVDKLPNWHGECVAIVASGSSAKTFDLSLLKDRIHVVAVNNSRELCPWADMLYACDVNWWNLNRGASEFKGIKVTQDVLARQNYPALIRIEVQGMNDKLLTERLGLVGAGGNSAFQAMNLVVQMGATGIALIGCDLSGEHWHGRHLPPCTNPDESNFRRWRKSFNDAATTLTALGVDVVNCSPTSTIAVYPKVTIPQMLARWGL